MPELFLTKGSKTSGRVATSLDLAKRPQSTGRSSLLLCDSGLNVGGAGILNLLVIGYALRPHLRSRLTLGGRTLPRNPWVYGGQGFHLSYRYSCLHPHFWSLHGWFPFRFAVTRTLSYHASRPRSSSIRSFGIRLIANHFRRRVSR